MPVRSESRFLIRTISVHSVTVFPTRDKLQDLLVAEHPTQAVGREEEARVALRSALAVIYVMFPGSHTVVFLVYFAVYFLEPRKQKHKYLNNRADGPRGGPRRCTQDFPQR